MSRGLGQIQRRIVATLGASEETVLEGMTVQELRRRGPSVNRSNRRRAIRGLLSRGVVEKVVGSHAKQRVKLTLLPAVAALMDLSDTKRDAQDQGQNSLRG